MSFDQVRATSEIEVNVYLKYRFKNDLFVGSTIVSISQLLQQHSGYLNNFDKHVTIFDKSRVQTGVVFLTLNMQVDADALSNMVENLAVSSFAGASTST